MADTAQPPPGQLAYTGLDVGDYGIMAAAGAFAMVAGAVMARASRKRQRALAG